MPTTVVSTVGPGKTYANIPAWVTARKGNLPTRDTIEVAELYAGSIGELLLLGADWTVDSTHYIVVRCGPGQGHPGCFDTSKVYIVGVTDNPIWIQVGFTRIEPGISVLSEVDTGGIAGLPHAVLISHISADAPCIIDGVIAKVDNGGQCFRAEYCNVNTDHVFQNCVALKKGGTANAFRATNASILVRHGLALGVDTGFFADNDEGGFGEPAAPGRVTTENCYFSGMTCYHFTGTGSSIVKGAKDVTSNSEATEPSHRNISAATAGLLNATQGFEDPHLSASGFLRGKGAATSVASDLDGHARPGTPDVGPLQFTVPAEVFSSVGTGGTHASWAAWVADRKGNLAGRDTIEIVDIIGEVIGARLDGVDWGVNQKNFVQVRAASGKAHGGLFSTSGAYFKNASGTRDAFFCSVPGTQFLPGICFENSFYSGNDPRCLHIQDCLRGNPILIDGAFMKNAVVKDDCRMVWVENSSADPALPHRIRNTAVFTAGGNTAARGLRLHGRWKVHNCVVLCFGSSASGITADGGTTDVQNTYIASTTCYAVSGGGTINKGSNDATENGEASNPSLRNLSRTAVFVDGIPAAYPDTAPNLHQKEGSPLVDAGFNLASEGVVSDFEGQGRMAPYDIGVDEVYVFRVGVGSWKVPAAGKIWNVPSAGGRLWVVPADGNIEEGE